MPRDFKVYLDDILEAPAAPHAPTPLPPGREGLPDIFWRIPAPRTFVHACQDVHHVP